MGEDLEEGEAQVMMGRLVPLLQVSYHAVIIVIQYLNCSSQHCERKIAIALRPVCMYKLYLMTVKTWLQSNLPQGRLVSKS